MTTPLDLRKSALSRFIQNNKYSSISEVDGDDGEMKFAVADPWGDGSLIIYLPDEVGELEDVLNGLILPERLSAIYHIDDRQLEIIFTAFNLRPSHIELADRAFEFNFRNTSHSCSFARSTDKLLKVAEYISPRSASETNFRNMLSFNMYMETRGSDGKISHPFIRNPISFFIKNVDWDELDTISMLENLNFYMSYYDDESPIVIIHPDFSKNIAAVAPRTRYIRGEFPEFLNGRELDAHLLSFWVAAKDSNLIMKFMLYYRIIEYVAIGWIDETIRRELRRQLSAPDASLNIDKTIERMVSSMNIQKLDDTARFRSVIRNVVDPDILWNKIEKNKNAFSCDTTFDGGFCIKAFVSKNDTIETFRSGSIDKFSERARKIRNALSHGKDMESSGVITPSKHNFELLKPWVHLMAVAAGETVLYKDVIS